MILRNDHLTGNTLLGAGVVHHIISAHADLDHYAHDLRKLEGAEQYYFSTMFNAARPVPADSISEPVIAPK